MILVVCDLIKVYLIDFFFNVWNKLNSIFSQWPSFLNDGSCVGVGTPCVEYVMDPNCIFFNIMERR